MHLTQYNFITCIRNFGIFVVRFTCRLHPHCHSENSCLHSGIGLYNLYHSFCRGIQAYTYNRSDWVYMITTWAKYLIICVINAMVKADAIDMKRKQIVRWWGLHVLLQADNLVRMIRQWADILDDRIVSGRCGRWSEW